MATSSTSWFYGSVARNATHKESDIGTALICRPFRDSRHVENTALRRVRWELDTRISPYCLHLKTSTTKRSFSRTKSNRPVSRCDRATS